MRIFFTTPFDVTKKHQVYIDAILDTLHTNAVSVISPEEQRQYVSSLKQYEAKGMQPERAHYAFITHGIAEADMVIIEATNEDIRVGHEVTLALLYGKPTLVLSQKVDFAKYIPHELLQGATYKTEADAQHHVKKFLDDAEKNLARVVETAQSLENGADSLHTAALASIRQHALRDTSEFGEWARLSEKDPEGAYKAIQKSLGKLPVGLPWSTFAPVYNEDSPDYIQTGVAKFVDTVLRQHRIKKSDYVVEAATGTGALLRVMANLGYRNLAGFDNSRPMLAEAFRLCAYMPDIHLFESDIAQLEMNNKPNAIIWPDYSSNFALTTQVFHDMLQRLIDTMADKGALIFDVRTLAGWQVNFYRQKVTTFSTPNFQRVWINLPDYDKHLITFDVFIRQRTVDGKWTEWQREQMTERMWLLDEVKKIVSGLNGVRLKGIYADDFAPLESVDHEPGLAYFVLEKK